MPSITIRVNFQETTDVGELYQLERDFFPGEHLIEADQTSYVLELDAERSQFLLEQIRLIPEFRGFEPFAAWREHQRDQMPLSFGNIHNLTADGNEALIA